jgi:hypothetical protein
MGVKCGVCFLLIRPVVGKKVIIVKFVKYILGVNRKTTNIAVMSELGRYPIYFSVILAMLKYCLYNNHFFSYNWTNQQKTYPTFHSHKLELV